MNRIFTLLFFVSVAFSALHSQTVISYKLLKSFSKTQVDSVLNANGIPAAIVGTKFGVDIYQVLYKTPYKHPDSLVQASGALALPQNAPCGVPLAIWEHGTDSKVADAASTLTGGQWQLGIGFAATGYAVALPDFLGLGLKDPKVVIHPYQHAFHEANTSVNMLRASREISTNENIGLNGQIFLFGYSQGGYVTLATSKEIQLNLGNEFQVAGAVPMSGSYDLDGAQYDMMKSDSAYATPGYLPFLTLGYNSVLGTLFNDPSDIFKAPYDSLLPPRFYSGNYGIGSINSICNPVPKKMFKDSIVDAIFADSLHPFRTALRDNNLVKGWVPQFPIRLYYCRGDEQVSYLNSEVAYNTWSAASAPNLAKQDFGNLSHTACAQSTILYAKSFFDSLKIDCTTGIVENKLERDFYLYPNPTQQVINIKVIGALSGSTAYVYSTTGALIKDILMEGEVASVKVTELPPGLYFLRVNTNSGFKSKSFIKE